eukprot:328565_1
MWSFSHFIATIKENTCTPNSRFLIMFIPCIVALVITAWFTHRSVSKLRKMTKLRWSIKYLHYVDCALSIFNILCIAIQSIFCVNTTFKLMGFGSYLAIQLCVLGTLLLRLDTFKGTIWELSKCETSSIVMLVFVVIVSLFAITVVTIDLFRTGESQFHLFAIHTHNELVVSLCGVVASSLYIVTSIYAMYIFGNKMYQIAKIKASSMNDVMDESQIKVNAEQIRLLHQVSRYVSVLSIAIAASMIAFVIFCTLHVINDEKYNISFGPILPLTCIVNVVCSVICLYLQYPFAIRHYEKYCKCCAHLSDYLFQAKTERDMVIMHRKSVTRRKSRNAKDSNPISIYL